MFKYLFNNQDFSQQSADVEVFAKAYVCFLAQFLGIKFLGIFQNTFSKMKKYIFLFKRERKCFA